jgi:hypothetical protein
MFQMISQQCKIAHVDLREEKHGDESVTAVDLKLQASVSNDFLSYLSPRLKGSLYDKPDGSVQGTLVHDNPGYMPRLLYPQLPALAWVGEMLKAQVVLHGAKKKDDIVVTADVNKLRLECMDGGTVIVSFRIQVIPEASVLGKLVALLGVETKVSVCAADEELTDPGDAE